MTDEPASIVLEHLRSLDRKIDGLAGDMQQVILRLGSIEQHMAGVTVVEVNQNAEIDRIKARLERVERRLELNDS